uniref:Uncharacterized protein n=1 Tax=Cucumis melo TaxID=3656 RepID=A0A9I9EDM1_CUCME
MRTKASNGAFLHSNQNFMFFCQLPNKLSVKRVFVYFMLTSIGVPLKLGGTTTPIPLPLGNRKQLGLSSIAAAVATMCISSASSAGAMTIMFGKQAMYVISNAPQCVGPSAPTKPALSIAKRTGSISFQIYIPDQTLFEGRMSK